MPLLDPGAMKLIPQPGASLQGSRIKAHSLTVASAVYWYGTRGTHWGHGASNVKLHSGTRASFGKQFAWHVQAVDVLSQTADHVTASLALSATLRQMLAPAATSSHAPFTTWKCLGKRGYVASVLCSTYATSSVELLGQGCQKREWQQLKISVAEQMKRH